MGENDDAIPGDLASFVPLESPPDRYWADPFPVERDGSYWLYFEEFVHATARGRIAVRLARRAWREALVAAAETLPSLVSVRLRGTALGTWCPKRSKTAPLNCGSTRSFPIVGGSKGTCWRACAVDSTFLDYRGRFWMFICMAEEGARAIRRTVPVSCRHPTRPLVSASTQSGGVRRTSCAARRPRVSIEGQAAAAGPGLRRMLRPPIHFREIVTLSPHEYVERPLATIEPNWAPGLTAAHAWNRAGALTVIDGFRHRRKSRHQAGAGRGGRS